MINQADPSPAVSLFQLPTEKRIWVTNSNYINPIGTGFYGSITFPPNVNTTFIMTLSINYSPGPSGALKYFIYARNTLTFMCDSDPTLNEIIQLCVEGDLNVDSGRRTVISYQAVNSVGALRFIGYNPTMSGQLRIRCPFQGIYHLFRLILCVCVGKARVDFINAITNGAGVPKQSN